MQQPTGAFDTSTSGAPADCALLIDWENFKFSLLNRGHQPNVSALREIAERQGRVVVAKAYADWGEHPRDAESLYAAGIEPSYVPTIRRGGDGEPARWKNSVDVKLTADCIELSHQYPNIRVFVLVSGDLDFLHVVNTLRPSGRRVVLVGLTWSLSLRLAERVDEVVYYDRAALLEADPAKPPGQAAPAAAPDIDGERLDAAVQRVKEQLGLADEETAAIAQGLRGLVALVHDARRRQAPFLLSQAGEAFRHVPGHVYRQYIKGHLKLMAQELQAVGLIKVVTHGLVDWLHLPGESTEPAYEPNRLYVERWEDLSQQQRQEALAAIRRYRTQPGISFLTFNPVCGAIQQALPDLEAQGVRRLVNDMVERGIIRRVGERDGFDPLTGKAYTYPIFELAQPIP